MLFKIKSKSNNLKVINTHNSQKGFLKTHSILKSIPNWKIYVMTVLSCLCIAFLICKENDILFFGLTLIMVLAVIIFSRPEIGAMLYIFLVVTVFNVATMPSIKLPGLGQLYVPDLVLIYVLVVLILRYPRSKLIQSPLTLPLFIYFSIRVVTDIYSTIAVGELKPLFTQLRAELPLLIFFVLISAGRQNRSWVSIVRYLCFCGIFMAVFYFYAAITRNQQLLSSPIFWLRSDVDITQGEVPRIVALGMPIIYPLFFLLFAWTLFSKKLKIRFGTSILTICFAMLIIFHGFRGLWYSTAAALLLIFVSVIIKRKVISKGLFLIVIAVVIFSLLSILSPHLPISNSFKSVIPRTLSLFDFNNPDFSFFGRFEELQWGWPLILARPILGWGVNVPPNPIFLKTGLVTPFVHIGYESLLLNYGFLGLFAFLWLIGVYFKYTWRTLMLLHDPFQRGLILGFMGYTAQLLLASLTNPGVAETSGVVLLILGFTITVLLGDQIQKARISKLREQRLF